MDLDIRTSKYIRSLLQVEKRPSAHVIHVREVEELIDAHFSQIDQISEELHVGASLQDRQCRHSKQLIERAIEVKASLLRLKFDFQRCLLTKIPPVDGVRLLRHHFELCLLWEAEAGQFAGVLWEHRQISVFQTECDPVDEMQRAWQRISHVREDHVHCLRLLSWNLSVDPPIMHHVLTEIAGGLEEMLSHWQEARMTAEDHNVALEVFGWDDPALQVLGSAKVLIARAQEAVHTRTWNADLLLDLGVVAKDVQLIVNVSTDEVLRCSIMLKHREVTQKALSEYAELHQVRSFRGFLGWFHREYTPNWVDQNYTRLASVFEPLYERYFYENVMVVNLAQISSQMDNPSCVGKQGDQPASSIEAKTGVHNTPISDSEKQGDQPASSIKITTRDHNTPINDREKQCDQPASSIEAKTEVHNTPISDSEKQGNQPASSDEITTRDHNTPISDSEKQGHQPASSDEITTRDHNTPISDSEKQGDQPATSDEIITREHNDREKQGDQHASSVEAKTREHNTPISDSGKEECEQKVAAHDFTENQRVTSGEVKRSQACEMKSEKPPYGCADLCAQAPNMHESTTPVYTPSSSSSSTSSASSMRETWLKPHARFGSPVAPWCAIPFSPDMNRISDSLPNRISEDIHAPLHGHTPANEIASGFKPVDSLSHPTQSSSSTDTRNAPLMPFGVHNFIRCMSESPPLLPDQEILFKDSSIAFLMTRNKKSDVVIYRVLEGIEPPVEVFWWNLGVVPHPANLRSELSWVEKKFAYGISCSPQLPHYELRIVALRNRPFILSWGDRYGRPVCLGRVLNRVCIVYRAHIHTSETSYWPKIEWINLHGIEVTTGVELVETINV